ncbi:MAG TPA: peptidase domain-containing ABC transporter [Burkholderiaceae bacterium]|nr:peptidase domain-containing ABC transporter [Burkholderiaceae bacterium]
MNVGKRVPLILQSEAPECGIACVAMIASYHGFRTDLSALRLRLSPSMRGVTLKHLSAVAETMKLSARGVQAPLSALGQLRLPAILHWDMNHFVVLTQVRGDRITVHDPAVGKRIMKLDEASRHYTGVAMEMQPAPGFVHADERQKISAWQLLGVAATMREAIVQVAILSLVLEVFAIAAPFFVQLVVDRVVVGRDADLLAVLGVGFALLVLMQVTVTAVRAWLGVYLSTQINLRLLDSLFGQLLRLPLAWFEKRHIGDIVSRFRSVDAIQRTLTLTFVETAIDGAMVLLTLAVMIWYSATLTLVVLLAALLYGAARWAFLGPQRRAADEQIIHEARAGTHFIETLRGMLAIKLNMREPERRGAYNNLVIEQTNASVATQKIVIAHRALNGLIFGLENVAVVWLAALLVMNGRFSVGMLFGFLSFKLLFITRINNLVDKAIEFRMLDLHAERIADIALATAEAPSASAGHSSGGLLHLEAKGISFAYGAEGPVFRDIDFSVQPGETVAIVGPSGCGKTTLVKVLIGLLDRNAGMLTANERDVRDWDRAALRSRLGVVLADDQLFVGTIEDNISFFDPKHDATRVRACARAAMIDRDIEAMPMGYNTIVGSLAHALSAGQKQRILLARALYRGPQILFLDEAFDQLDLALESRITDQLRRLKLGIVIVSHRPETIRQVDRIVRLGGRIEEPSRKAQPQLG